MCHSGNALLRSWDLGTEGGDKEGKEGGKGRREGKATEGEAQ